MQALRRVSGQRLCCRWGLRDAVSKSNDDNGLTLRQIVFSVAEKTTQMSYETH